MIELLVALLVAAVVLYVINLLIAQMALPPVVKTIAYLIIGLVFLFWLLQFLGLYSGGPAMTFPR